MAIAAERVWAVPAYLPYRQPALTAEVVAAAERQLGVRLPGGYLRLLEVQNGGYLRAGHRHWPAAQLWGIGPELPSLTGGLARWQDGADDEGWVPQAAHLLVPFDGDGHWYLCLDYRQAPGTDEPAVTFVDVESEAESPVAPSFEAFLAELDQDDDAAALRSHQPVPTAELAGRLAEGLGLPLVDQGAWDYGYPVLRIGADGSWVWVSPNRVPAGFSRDGDAVVVTPETALRLPDDPGCVHLVTCTDDLAAAVRALLAPAGADHANP